MDSSQHDTIVRKMIDLFAGINSGDSSQQANIFYSFEELQENPNFALYLTNILTFPEDIPMYVRAAACFRLRRYVVSRFEHMNADLLSTIRDQCFSLVGCEDSLIRNSVTDLLSRLGTLQCLSGWAPYIQRLCQMLEQGGTNLIGAMSCLYKLSDELTNEDETALLMGAIKVEGSMESWLGVLIPRFIALTQSPHEDICKDALSTLLCYAYYLPPELKQHIGAYRDSLLALARADRSSAVRELLCSSLSALVTLQYGALHSGTECVMDEVVAFMLHCSQHEDDYSGINDRGSGAGNVSQRACEFWDSMLGDQQTLSARETMARHAMIKRHLPAAVPVLLKCTVYTDVDLMMMAGELGEDADAEDRDQDICPRSYNAQRKGEDEDDEQDDDDDDEVAEWTTRKAAATALDHLARALPDEVLGLAQHPLQGMLTSEHWPDREAGVLVIGAMSFGCLDQMTPLLAPMLPPLLGLLQDANPLLRSTACWTLACYAHFIASPAAGGALAGLLDGLMRCVLDRTKKVQYAACSALATVASAVPEQLAAFLLPLSQGLLTALPQYRARNTPLLLDALQTVVAAAGPALGTPALMQAAVLPLLAQWDRVADGDRAAADYLICLYHVVAGLGAEHAPSVAPQLYARALRIITGTLEELTAAHAAAPGAELDSALTNVLAAALDLVSALIEALGGSFAALLADSPLPSLLLAALALPHDEVRQPALAAAGDLAKACADASLLPVYVAAADAAAASLTPDPARADLCNNAAWALGELAPRLGPHLQPLAAPVCTRLAALLAAETSDVSSALHVSAATTLGRVAAACPEVVGPGLAGILGPWCYWLSKIRHVREKVQAYQGLDRAVRAHPACLAVEGVGPVAMAIAAWKAAPHGTLQTMGELMHWVRAQAGPQWADMWALVPEQARTHLGGMYSL